MIVLFTSKFSLGKSTDEEIVEVIVSLIALKINLIVFGYEIGQDVAPEPPHYQNDYE